MQTLVRSVVVLGLIFGLGAVSYFTIGLVMSSDDGAATAMTHEQKVERIFVEEGLPPSGS